MKRNYALLIFLLFCLSLLSGVLTAGISIVGRVGVALFYKQYQFFKVWWQGALVCFISMLVVAAVLFFINKYTTPAKAKIFNALFLLAGMAGLYFTFKDFRNDISHRWLGERFHLGIYLYWIGFGGIALFYLLTKSRRVLKIQ